jgi:hypothetical protein
MKLRIETCVQNISGNPEGEGRQEHAGVRGNLVKRMHFKEISDEVEWINVARDAVQWLLLRLW